DRIVVRAEVGNDGRKPVGTVIGVSGAGEARCRTVIPRGGELDEIVAGPGQIGVLGGAAGGIRRGHAGQQAADIAISQRVVVAVLAGGDAPALGIVIGFDRLGIAVRPGPGVGREGQRVIGAAAFLADIGARAGIVGIDGVRSVPIG